MVDSFHDGIGFRLSKGFFEHVAEGLYVGIVVEVGVAFARQGEDEEAGGASADELILFVVNWPFGFL